MTPSSTVLHNQRNSKALCESIVLYFVWLECDCQGTDSKRTFVVRANIEYNEELAKIQT